MKRTFTRLTTILLSMFLVNAAVADNVTGTHVVIDGLQAKQIYNALTGGDVEQQGAAGHLFRQGKSITCRYTNADMSDNAGKTITREDPTRYLCAAQIDKNGLASKSTNFES